MERVFQIAAAILGGIAAYYLWQNDSDRLFIFGVAGSIAFFLSVRSGANRRMREREAEAQINHEPTATNDPEV